MKTLFYEPGSPWKKTLRRVVPRPAEAKVLIERWRCESHSSLGYWPPAPEDVQHFCLLEA